MFLFAKISLFFTLAIFWVSFAEKTSNPYVSKPNPTLKIPEVKQVKPNEFLIADISSYTYLSRQRGVYDKKSYDVYKTINSISATGIAMTGYFNGMNLAVWEINSKGGIEGRQLKIVSIDDRANPYFAERFAEKVITQRGVVAFMGGNLPDTSLSVARIAEKYGVLYINTGDFSDALSTSIKASYSYRLRPSAYAVGSIWANKASTQKATRWIIVVSDDKYGSDLSTAFSNSLKKKNPNAQIKTIKLLPFAQIQNDFFINLGDPSFKADGVFLAIYGNDLVELINNNPRKQVWTLNNKIIMCLECGSPETNYYIKTKIPKGWIAGGYPAYFIKNPTHKKFYSNYVDRYRTQPLLSSLYGYTAVYLIARQLANKQIQKPNSLSGASVDTVFGTIKFREDHQSTNGVFIGNTLYQKGSLFLTQVIYNSAENTLAPLQLKINKAKNNKTK